MADVGAGIPDLSLRSPAMAPQLKTSNGPREQLVGVVRKFFL